MIIPYKNKTLVFDFIRGLHVAQNIESFAHCFMHCLTSLTLDVV